MYKKRDWEQNTKAIYEYIETKSMSVAQLSKHSQNPHLLCPEHYYTIFQDNINSWQYYKNNRSFDQTKHYRVKVTVKRQA